MKNKKFNIYYGWWVVFSSFIIASIAFGGSYIFGLFFQPWQNEFGWSRAQISWAYSFNLLGYGFFCILVGWLIDRYSTWIIAAAGGLLSAVGFFLSSYVNNLWQLYLIWGLVIALGMSTCWTPQISATSRWFPVKRGIPLGIVAAGTGVGTILFPPLIEQVISSYDWHKGLIAFAIISFIGIVFPALLLKNPPQKLSSISEAVRTDKNGSSKNKTAGGNTYTLLQTMKTRNLHLLLIGQLICSLLVRMVMIHIVPHAVDIGATTQTAALIVGIIGLSSVAGRLIMGAVQDKIGARKSFIMCISVEGLSLLILIFTSDLWFLYVFAVIFGFTYGGDVPQIPGLIVECFGLKRMGTIYGIMGVSVGFGGLLGPVLAGYAFDISGSYNIPFAIGVVLAFIAALAVYKLKIPADSQARENQ